MVLKIYRDLSALAVRRPVKRSESSELNSNEATLVEETDYAAGYI